MVRRGPASVSSRKSSSERFCEDCPDRSRPPPCMPDEDDPTVWSAGGTSVHDRPVSSLQPRCGTGWFRASRPAPTAFRGWRWRCARAACGHWWTNLFRYHRYCNALRRRIRRDAGNGPNEPCQLACDSGDHNLPQLAPRHHVTIALAQPGLRLPGDLAYRLWHGVNGGQLVTGDAGRETVAVCSLDQQGTSVNIARLGDGADAALGAGGMFRWHQADIGHEVGWRGKARRIANSRRQAGAGDRVQTAQGTQVPHQWEQRPGRDLRPQIAFKAVPPLFTQSHRLNTFPKHDLLRGLAKTLVGKPSSMRLGQRLPAIRKDPLVTQQKCTQLLTCRAHPPHRRQADTDQIAHRLVRRVRHPNRGQQSTPMQDGQAASVSLVVLLPLTAFAWNH